MENKMEMAMRIMNDVKASGAKLDTMDDIYSVVSNYVQLTREQFVEAYNKANEEMDSELSDAELDMVVGGGIGDFFKDHWKEVLIASAIVIGAGVAGAAIAVGIGAVLGGGSAAMAFIYGIGTAAAAASTGTLVASGVVGGLIGAGIGACVANKVLD